MNADVVANGTVYANGPVFVMGMDIKAEIEKVKNQLEEIKKHKPEEIEKVILLLVEKSEFSQEEKSSLKKAFDTAIKITDWASRIQFWYDTIKLMENPFLWHTIVTLVRLGLS